MGLAWAPSPHPSPSSSSSSSSSSTPSLSSSSSLTPPLPASLVPRSDNLNSNPKAPDLEYLLARMATSQLPPPSQDMPDSHIGTTLTPDPKMSLKHFNVDPLLLSPSARETLWPSLILQVLLLYN